MAFLSTDPFPAPARKRDLSLRISREQVNFIAFSLWCVVTFVQFPRDELLLYPLALYYAFTVYRDQRKILPLLARSWFVLPFALWCIISPLWAIVPVSAVKHSVYLSLTLLICVQVAATMSPRRILHAILLATGLIGVINIIYAFGTGDIVSGIFAQKNAMGKNMVVLWVIASATMMDRGSALWIRLGAVGLAVIAVFMTFMSNSATAVLLVFATGMINVFGAVFLVGGLLRLGKLATLCLGITLVIGAAAVVLPSLEASPVDAVLGAFGKDSTLTGRTVLWQHAEDQIAERPYLGVGAGGFWRYYESPLVQKIYADFYKTPEAHFNFHNSYYEIAVHEGLIGLFFAVFALIWGVYQVSRGALIIGTVPHVYFLTHTLSVLVRTATEADFLKPFVLFHMIFWIGAFATVRAIQPLKAARTL